MEEVVEVSGDMAEEGNMDERKGEEGVIKEDVSVVAESEEKGIQKTVANKRKKEEEEKDEPKRKRERKNKYKNIKSRNIRKLAGFVSNDIDGLRC